MSEEPTIYTTDATLQLTAAEYHSLPGVSHSRLKVAIGDIRQYDYQFRSGEYVPEKKDYFDIGTCVHDIALRGIDAAVLIPERVLSSSGTRSGGAWKAFAAEHAGEILLKQADYDRVLRCVEALHSHPMASNLLSLTGFSEEIYRHEDLELGLQLRCMVDRITDPACSTTGSVMVLDIKTTEQATTAGQFAKAAANFGYHTQEYFYRRVLRACGIEVDRFIFLVVRTKPAHTVDCYELDDEWFLVEREPPEESYGAQIDVEKALKNLAERERSGVWTSPTANAIVKLRPPGWLKYAGDYAIE